MELPGRIWSTEHVQPGQALGYWNEIVCESMLELKVDSPQPGRFCAALTEHEIGPLEAYFIVVDEQYVSRTQQQISRSRSRFFSLVQPRRGGQYGEHRGRSVSLNPGDCVLVDTSEPFEFGFPQGSDCLSLRIPADWLQGWLAAPEDGSARVFRQHDGWDRTLTSALANLTATSIAGFSLPGDVVAEQIAALLALAIGPQTSAETTHKQALLRRMRATLRESFQDPAFDPSALAAAHGLSRRYVHTVFAASHTTFGRELNALRLERAARLLGDPRFDAMGISEIAWSCGFTAPSHFAQRFRQQFGMQPSAYRLTVRS